MPTDLQKKDELRRELRLLQLVSSAFENIDELTQIQDFAFKSVRERIEDIQKALED